MNIIVANENSVDPWQKADGTSIPSEYASYLEAGNLLCVSTSNKIKLFKRGSDKILRSCSFPPLAEDMHIEDFLQKKLGAYTIIKAPEIFKRAKKYAY